ncbi:MAG: iron-sulfur cluster assembly accessory protein [Actinomycetota bacterium]|nr:iron-sulfur cluster assembly accessory protein [Actinomycetota bacterium]
MDIRTETPALTVTEKAARRVRSVAEREGKPGAYLRVRVVAGGCDGFTYELGLEDQRADGDQVIEAFGLEVLVDGRSAPILQGSILEFNDSLLGGGLKVYNPQAVHECTCGKSFAI